MAYREDREALERERARLVQGVEELEARWTDTFWREVAPSREVAPPRAVSPSGGLEAEVERLAARLEVLRALERSASRIVADWGTPPALLGPRLVFGGLGVRLNPWLRPAVQRAAASMLEVVEREDPESSIRVRARAHRSQHGLHLVVQLETTVAPSVPELRVRHEGMFDEVRKLLGSGHDIQIGVDGFDGVFAIEGDEPTARALLDAETRASLLRMGEGDPVDVRVRAGVATVGRRTASFGDADAGWVQRACRVARALRSIPARPLRAQ
ncbi:MAG: hypothetical protein EVA89_38925 [Sandaracinaceae bacterium]|nr:MAG: hypothetical protein EVA89_38925 [Sandaracinaceae bacterium]